METILSWLLGLQSDATSAMEATQSPAVERLRLRAFSLGSVRGGVWQGA